MESKIDICMIVTSILDGDPRVQKAARSAHQNGHNIAVVCRSYSGPDLGYKIIPLNVARPDKRWLKYFERLWFNVLLLWTTISLRPRVVHANDLDTLPAGLLAGWITGAKVLFDAHEYFSTAGRDVGGLGQKLLHVMEYRLIRLADSVITVSENLAQAMATDLNIKKPLVVMNAAPFVDTSGMPPGEWISQFAGKRVVLFQGKFSPHRGLPETIRTAKYLPDDVVMALRGFGHIEDELRNLVVEENLEEKVIFIPPVPMFDLVRSAVGADVGVFPCDSNLKSKLYAAPNKLFEYIMAGLPCVATDTPEVRSIVIDHKIGDVFAPLDPKDTARAIMAVLDKPRELEQMKKRCLEIASNFSWEVEAEKLLAKYQQMLTTSLAL